MATELKDGKIPQTEEELRKAVGEPAPSAQPEEIVVELPTGEVFKGKTQQEVIDKLASAKVEATRTIQGQRAALREAASQAATARAPTSAFERDRYFTLMADDPMLAQDYLQAARLGVPPEQVRTIERWVYDTTWQVDARMHNASFRTRFPDAPAGEEFAELMAQRLAEEGREWTARDLGDTYLELVHEGKVKPVAGTSERGQSDRPPAPAPSLSRGGPGGNSDDEVARFTRMTTAEMEQYLRERGYK